MRGKVKLVVSVNTKQAYDRVHYSSINSSSTLHGEELSASCHDIFYIWGKTMEGLQGQTGCFQEQKLFLSTARNQPSFLCHSAKSLVTILCYLNSNIQAERVKLPM